MVTDLQNMKAWAVKELKSLRDQIRELKAQNVDVSELQGLFTRARPLMEDNDFASLEGLISNLKAMLAEATAPPMGPQEPQPVPPPPPMEGVPQVPPTPPPAAEPQPAPADGDGFFQNLGPVAALEPGAAPTEAPQGTAGETVVSFDTSLPPPEPGEQSPARPEPAGQVGDSATHEPAQQPVVVAPPPVLEGSAPTVVEPLPVPEGPAPETDPSAAPAPPAPEQVDPQEKERYQRALDVIMACRDRLAELGQKGGDVEYAFSIMNKAKPLLKEKEFDKAHRLGLKLLEYLAEVEQGKAPHMIDVEAVLAEIPGEADGAGTGVSAQPEAEPSAPVEPAAMAAPEPVQEPAAETTGETAAEPAGEPAPEPAGETTAEPAGEPAPEPAGEPAPEPAGEPAAETAGETTAETAEGTVMVPVTAPLGEEEYQEVPVGAAEGEAEEEGASAGEERPGLDDIAPSEPPPEDREFKTIPPEEEGDLMGMIARFPPGTFDDMGFSDLYQPPALEGTGRSMEQVREELGEVEEFLRLMDASGIPLEEESAAVSGALGDADELYSRIRELADAIERKRAEILRERFTQQVGTASGFLDDLASMGVGLREETGAWAGEAKEALGGADYIAIPNLLNRLVTMADEDRRHHAHCVIETRMRALEGTLDNAAKDGASVEGLTEMIAEGRSLCSGGDFAGALKKEAEAKAVLDRAVYDNRRSLAEGSMAAASQSLDELEGLELDGSEERGRLEGAGVAMEAEKFEDARRLADSVAAAAGAKMTQYHSERIKVLIEEMKGELEGIKELGANFEMSERLINQGTKEWEGENFGRAEEVLERGKKALKAARTQYQRERAETAVEEGRRELTDIDEKGVDMAEAWKRLDNLSLDVGVGKYDGIPEAVQECIEFARGAEADHFRDLSERTITDFEAKKGEMEELGPDFTEVDAALEGLRKLHAEGAHHNVIGKREEVEKLFEEALATAKKDKTSKVKETLGSVKGIIDEFREHNVDFKEAEKLCNSAEAELERENLQEAASLSDQALAKAEGSRDGYRRTKALEEKNRLDEAAGAAGRYRVDISAVEPAGAEFAGLMEGGRFEEAARTAGELADELEKKAQDAKNRLARESSAALKFTQANIDELEGMNIDTTELRELFGQADAANGAEEYVNAMDIARRVDEKGRGLKNEALKARLNEKLEGAEGRLATYRGENLDVQSAEEVKAQVGFALNSGQYAKAGSLMKNLEEQLEGLEGQYQTALRQRSEQEAKERVEEAARRKAEEEGALKAEEEARAKAEEEARAKAEGERRRGEAESAAAAPEAPGGGPGEAPEEAAGEAGAGGETGAGPEAVETHPETAAAGAARVEVPEVEVPDMTGMDVDAQKHKVVGALKEAREHIARGKGKGLDMKLPEELFNKARPFLGKGDFQQALRVAVQGVALVRRMEYVDSFGEPVDTRSRLAEAKSLLESAKSEMDERAAQTLDMARKVIGAGEVEGRGAPGAPAGDGEGAGEGGGPPGEEGAGDKKPPAPQVTQAQVIAALKSARQTIATAKSKGKDVTRAEQLFRTAQPALQKGDLPQALQIARDCIMAVRDT